MRVLTLALCVALGAPVTARAVEPSRSPASAGSSPCEPGSPGYECVSRRELWEASVRFRAKWMDERLAHAETRVRLAGVEAKLAVRTSTAIRDLVPPPPALATSEHSTTVLVISTGLALVAGVVIGAVFLKRDEPSTIVVK